MAKKVRDARVYHEVEEEITENHPIGEERQQLRRQRTPDDRIDRMEVKHDKLNEKVDMINSKVDVMVGKLDVLPKLVDAVKDASDRAAEREQVTFTAQVDIHKEHEITKIKDEASLKDFRRKLILKVAGITATVFSVLAAAVTLAIDHC